MENVNGKERLSEEQNSAEDTKGRMTGTFSDSDSKKEISEETDSSSLTVANSSETKVLSNSPLKSKLSNNSPLKSKLSDKTPIQGSSTLAHLSNRKRPLKLSEKVSQMVDMGLKENVAKKVINLAFCPLSFIDIFSLFLGFKNKVSRLKPFLGPELMLLTFTTLQQMEYKEIY